MTYKIILINIYMNDCALLNLVQFINFEGIIKGVLIEFFVLINCY